MSGTPLTPNNTPALAGKKGRKNRNKKNKRQQKNPQSQRSLGHNNPNTTTAAPVAVSYTRKIKAPHVNRSTKNGDITVEHTEFIADINGSQTFQNKLFTVNPGLAATFPWLSSIGPMYESYRFEKLRFDYQPMASSSTNGSVMLAVDYDASDPAAATKQALATYRGYVRTAPWAQCCNTSIAEDLKKRTSYYIRTGALGTNQDVKLYDVGNLNVATVGMTDGSIVGELYVTYRVRLMTPQTVQNGLGMSQSARFTGTTLALGLAPVAGNNAPLAVTGTGAAATFTALAPYQGILNIRMVGATFTNIAISGTAPNTALGAVTSADGTVCTNTVYFNADTGQTVIVTPAAASSSSINYRVGQYNVALG